MPHYDSQNDLRGDAAFMGRLRDGDDSAFDILVNTYAGPLIVHASRIIGSVDSAREAVQDVFLKLWNDRAQIEDKWDIGAYLYGLTRKRAIDVVRSDQASQRRQYLWLGEHHIDASLPTFPSDEPADKDAQIRARVWNALGELPPRCREVFMLVWDQQLSYAIIAQRLGIAEPTARRHMSRAIQHLSAAFKANVDYFEEE